MNQCRNTTWASRCRRGAVLLGLGAALALATAGATQAVALARTPIQEEVLIIAATDRGAVPLEGGFVPAAHIPRLPE
jgi:hypothetical protein